MSQKMRLEVIESVIVHIYNSRVLFAQFIRDHHRIVCERLSEQDAMSVQRRFSFLHLDDGYGNGPQVVKRTTTQSYIQVNIVRRRRKHNTVLYVFFSFSLFSPSNQFGVKSSIYFFLL